MTPEEIFWAFIIFIILGLLPDELYTTYTSLQIDKGIELREAERGIDYDLLAYSAFGLNEKDED